MPKASIIIAAPNASHRARLYKIFHGSSEFKVSACTKDLMNTYNEVEEQTPQAVLISDTLASLPEFEVMHALFSTLDIRWLIIKSSADPKMSISPGQAVRHKKSDLFAISLTADENQILDQLRSLTRTGVSRLSPMKAPVIPTPTNGFDRQICLPRSNRNSRTRNFDRHAALPPRHLAQRERLILIGASTGGVDALLSVLSHFPDDCPPTLIVQHTGKGFGDSLVRLLDRQCRANVRLAMGRSEISRGVITVGAGTQSHLIISDCNKRVADLGGSEPVSGHTPSVDELFLSALPLARSVTAALLTGMGRDGARGLRALRDAGATTIAQDEQSSVVFGMPRSAIELGAASKVLPLKDIGPALLEGTKLKSNGRELL